MKKIIALIAIAISLTACKNDKSNPVISTSAGEAKAKVRIDSTYAAYSLGNSLEAYMSKVFIIYKDTSLMAFVDSSTQKKVDTTLKQYYIPRLDTAFADQNRRQKPLFDSATKKIKTTIVWLPINEKFILKDFKAK